MQVAQQQQQQTPYQVNNYIPAKRNRVQMQRKQQQYQSN